MVNYAGLYWGAVHVTTCVDYGPCAGRQQVGILWDATVEDLADQTVTHGRIDMCVILNGEHHCENRALTLPPQP